jgi:hypothetical protein
MKQFLLLLILFLLISCQQQFTSEHGIDYFNDSNLSTNTGTIIDSSRFFLPPDSMLLTLWNNTRIDTFKLKWFSANYLCFKEPILYNHYLGYENYRFLWIRSFHRPVLIKVIKAKKVAITTKILENQPAFMSEIYLPEYRPHDNNRGEVGTFITDLVSLKQEFPNADSIVVPKYNTKVVLDTTYYLSPKQWSKLKELLDSCQFWTLKSTKTILGFDGSEWILEGQSQNKYKFVVRWCPEGSFEKCCEYLIELSAAKSEKIY